MRHGKAISIINGEVISRWENDKPKIEIKWDTYTWDDGKVYEGYWKGKYPHGQGKMTYANGEWRKGEFEEGEFISGEGKWIYDSGDVYEGGFKDGKRHGFYEYRWANGAVETGNLEEGKEHGRIWYDGDGDGLGYALQYEYGQRVFRVGRTVKLNSGSPAMTISAVNKKTITCEWFSYGKLKSEDFNEDKLKIIE
jgi:uncharacterized protein YodC (DUF2158 family)